MFVWQNLLLGCTECGRLKGDRFPLATDGAPLLVNPSEEDPWMHLDFEPDTGHLTARWESNGNVSTKGQATVGLLRLDQREALERVYQRTFRRLCAEVEAALAGSVVDTSLLDRLRRLDDHGLLGWCFSERGAGHAPFSTLRSEFTAIWTAGVAQFSFSP